MGGVPAQRTTAVFESVQGGGADPSGLVLRELRFPPRL